MKRAIEKIINLKIRPFRLSIVFGALVSGACLAVAIPAYGLDAEQIRTCSDTMLLKQVRIARCGTKDMDALLPELQRRFPVFESRVAAIAQLYKGAPYVADPLADEPRDWLPYRETNCTMFVLYVEALANSRTMAQAREHMRDLHYRGGVVRYGSRYHFTEDRITDPANRYFTESTSNSVRDPKILRQLTIELNRKKDGSLLFGDRLGTWTRAVSLSYVPRHGFRPGMLAGLGRVTGVAFVKKENWGKGLAVGHEGLLIDGDLYHSSPERGVVVERQYLSAGYLKSPWEGMILFRLEPVQNP